MARQNAKGLVIGTVGPVSFRVLEGRQILQSKPGKGNMKQSKATKATAFDFGNASWLSKKIRIALSPLLLGFTDSKMYYRFTALIYRHSVKNITLDSLENPENDAFLQENYFECNFNSPFVEYCKLQPLIKLDTDGNVVVSLPEFHTSEKFRFPDSASTAVFCLLATVINPEDGSETWADVLKFSITDLNTVIPAQQWEIPAIAKNQWLVLTAAVLYYKNDRFIGNVGMSSKDFHPCAVIGLWKS